MTIRRVSLSPSQRFAYATIAAAAYLLVAWLDSSYSPLALHPSIPIQTAHFFALIIAGIQIIGAWLGTAAAATLTYLAAALQWLGARVLTILKSTGAMFAKTWDAAKIVWSDVLKPALKWLDARIKQIHDWLQRTLKPVFKWLQRVREELRDIYKRFVRPIVDTIEFIRQVNRALKVFHINLLGKLEQVLVQIEDKLQEPFEYINRWLNRLQNALDTVVTFDGFFQRITLIKSMAAYAPDWLRVFWNTQLRGMSPGEAASRRAQEYPAEEANVNGQELAAFYEGRPNRMDAYVAELVPLWREAARINA